MYTYIYICISISNSNPIPISISISISISIYVSVSLSLCLYLYLYLYLYLGLYLDTGRERERERERRIVHRRLRLLTETWTFAAEVVLQGSTLASIAETDVGRGDDTVGNPHRVNSTLPPSQEGDTGTSTSCIAFAL